MSRLIRVAGLALVVAAVVNELRKPPEERVWHGLLAGFIPYDLRVPTPGRVIRAVWNPENANLLGETPFGVGWTVNFRALGNVFRRPSEGS
jgi:hypothetical protein